MSAFGIWVGPVARDVLLLLYSFDAYTAISLPSDVLSTNVINREICPVVLALSL